MVLGHSPRKNPAGARHPAMHGQAAPQLQSAQHPHTSYHECAARHMIATYCPGARDARGSGVGVPAAPTPSSTSSR